MSLSASNRDFMEVVCMCPATWLFKIYELMLYWIKRIARQRGLKKQSSEVLILSSILLIGMSVIWLRHYATNRKVAGSIPDEVIF
jgi:hypothetical protein